MTFPPDHPRGPNGGPIFLREELCPLCECCSLSSKECWQCGGVGVYGHDCGEDTCCCATPYDDETCDICDGEGGFLTCLGGCDFDAKRAHEKPLSDPARPTDVELGKASGSASESLSSVSLRGDQEPNTNDD